jgi:hypothetical protein
VSTLTSTEAGRIPEPEGPDRLTPIQEKALHLAFSQILGNSGGYRTQCYPLTRVLRALLGDDPEARPRRRKGRPREMPNGRGAFKRLGMKPSDLDAEWARARARDGLLPRHIVVEFFPQRLWPAAAFLLDLGPAESLFEVEAIYGLWAQGLTVHGKERKDGPLSKNALAVYITGAWTLFTAFGELHTRRSRHGLDSFDNWPKSELPKRLSPAQLGAKDALRDVTGPSLELARRALRTLDLEVQRRRRRTQWRACSLLALRDRALIAILMVLGPRKAAIVEMTVGCYLPCHTFPDGTVGPALRIPTVKRNGVPRIKALPAVVATWLEEYLEFVGIASDLDSPMWRNRRYPNRGLDMPGVEYAVIRALAPFAKDGRKYYPHSLRHLAAKVLFLAGLDWLNEERDQLFDARHGVVLSADTFIDVGLDHVFGQVNERYRDIDFEKSREQWTRIAVVGAWEYLWGAKGARKVPDYERIQAALRDVHEATACCTKLERELEELEAAAVAGSERLTEKQLLVIVVQIGRVARALRAAGAEQQLAEQALEEAKRAEVPVDDLLDDLPTEPAFIHELEAEPDERPVLRRWATAAEFRWALGERIVSPATLRRWLRGRMPHPSGDPRNLWDPNPNPAKPPQCVERLSPRKQRIWIDRLDPARFHSDVWTRLDEITRRPAPDGWPSEPAP